MRRLRPLECLAALLCAAGCVDDDSPAPHEAEPEPEAVAPAELFPLTPGDRWRTETAAGTAHNVGVTGSEPSGIAVIHGTGHALAERDRASDEEVAPVDPKGAVRVPLLRAPLRAGEDWEYALRDRDVRLRFGLRHGPVLVRVSGDRAACPEESALRLASLLRTDPKNPPRRLAADPGPAAASALLEISRDISFVAPPCIRTRLDRDPSARISEIGS